MTQHKKNAIIGTIFLILFVGIPLGFILGPIFTAVFTFGTLMPLLKKDKKQVASKITEKQRQTDELITTILPVINSKN